LVFKKIQNQLQKIKYYLKSFLINIRDDNSDYVNVNKFNYRNISALIERGNKKLKSKDFIGAIDDYVKGIEINDYLSEKYSPRKKQNIVYYINLYKNLSIAKSFQKDYEGAINYFLKFLKIRIGFIREQLADKDLYELYEKYKKNYSVVTFSKDKKAFPKMLNIETFKRGKSLIQDYYDAIDELNSKFKLQPHNYEELLSRCNSIRKFAKYLQNNNCKFEFNPYLNIFDYSFSDFEKGGFKESIFERTKKAVFTNLVVRNPATIFYELIIKDSSRAIELNPKNGDAYLCRGSAKDELQDYLGAIYDYSKVIELNPHMEDALFRRGELKIKYKDFLTGTTKNSINEDFFHRDYRVTELPETLATNINNLELRLNESIISDFTEVIKINPNSANAFFFRGNAKNNKGKFLDALKDYSQAILLDPQNDIFLAKRAELKGDLGDYEGGIEDYYMALKLNPNKSIIYIDIDRLKTKLKQKINKQKNSL
tara:strand:- start:200 stop:1648 length:1449 start_codon:yes stop_codon:yes gene_type:complete